MSTTKNWKEKLVDEMIELLRKDGWKAIADRVEQLLEAQREEIVEKLTRMRIKEWGSDTRPDDEGYAEGLMFMQRCVDSLTTKGKDAE